MRSCKSRLLVLEFFVTGIFILLMIIELYMADFQILQTNHKLFILFYVFYAMCDICFALVTFLSARHIHVNSL